MPDSPRESQKRRLAKIRPHGLDRVPILSLMRVSMGKTFNPPPQTSVPRFRASREALTMTLLKLSH